MPGPQLGGDGANRRNGSAGAEQRMKRFALARLDAARELDLLFVGENTPTLGARRRPLGNEHGIVGGGLGEGFELKRFLARLLSSVGEG